MHDDLSIQVFLRSPCGMLVLEKRTGTVVAINSSLSKILGCRSGLDLSLPLSAVLQTGASSQTSRGVFEQKIRNAVMEERDGFTQMLRDASGISAEYLIRPRAINLDYREYILLSISKVSDMSSSNLLMEEALAEKEVLLREVHHRVKNNLQVISSLLQLQSQFVSDPKILGYMTDSQNRVRALAYIYEHLYRSKELGMIDFSEYTTRITQSLRREYGANAQNVAVQFDIHDVVLNPDTSVPLGLLLNELVSNAFRHAFPDEREGTIMISMHPNENGSYTLAIRDDGIGMPKGIRIEKIQSLGLLLVSSLVTQLDGTLELKTGKGTEFRIVFNPLKYKERE